MRNTSILIIISAALSLPACSDVATKSKSEAEIADLQKRSLNGDFVAMRSLYVEYEKSGDDENYKKWFSYALSKREPLAIKDRISSIKIDINGKCKEVLSYYNNYSIAESENEIAGFYKLCLSQKLKNKK